MARARLVTVEGIDGSGKSTFADGLAKALAERGVAVQRTAEPTSTWLGEAVRKALVGGEPPLVDALLFLADHAAHVPRVEALLARGVTVVSDRWSDSTLAYQGVALEGVVDDPAAFLRSVERAIDRTPDLTFLLDLPVEVALARMRSRARREKFEDGAFLGKVRRSYLALAAAEPARFVVLDATRPTEDLVREAAARVAGAAPRPSPEPS